MNTLSARGRFWRYVLFDEPERCWKWLGQYNEKGYGLCGFKGLGNRAHRAAWTLMRGPIPSGMCVLHRCDNPPCVNPKHLFLGTQIDNYRDAVAKGRSRVGASGERNLNSKLTRAQVLEIQALPAYIPAASVALDYGITTMHVYNLRKGRYWDILKKP